MREKKVGIAKASLHRWVCPRTKEILTTKGKAGRRSGENVFLLQVSGFFSFSEADFAACVDENEILRLFLI